MTSFRKETHHHLFTMLQESLSLAFFEHLLTNEDSNKHKTSPPLTVLKDHIYGDIYGVTNFVICHMTIVFNQFTHSIDAFYHDWFWTTFMQIVFQFESLYMYHLYTMVLDRASSTKRFFNRLMHSCELKSTLKPYRIMERRF